MSRPRLVHVLGGGFWQLPTVRRAKALGHRVLVTDVHDERPAYALADHHEVVDITDREHTLEVARRHGIDGILCDTTDVGVPTAAYVAEALGLPGVGLVAAQNTTDKARLRALAADIDADDYRLVSSPAQWPEAAQGMALPVVVKPVDNQSGRGVSVVREPPALQRAYEIALAHSRSRRVLLEPFIEGTEYIVDSLVLSGVPHILGIAQKTPYADNSALSSRILYLSGQAFDVLHGRLQGALTELMRRIALRDGLCHAEYIVNADRATVIDVAARGGGVMIHSHVVPHVSGVDAIAAAVALCLGDEVAPPLLNLRRGACIEFLRPPAGHFEELLGATDANRIPGVAATHWRLNPGDAVAAPTDKDQRPGFIVTLGDDAAAAVASAERAKACLRVKMLGYPIAQSLL